MLDSLHVARGLAPRDRLHHAAPAARRAQAARSRRRPRHRLRRRRHGHAVRRDHRRVHPRARRPPGRLGRSPRSRAPRRLRRRSALHARHQGRARRLPGDGHARGRARRRPGRHHRRATSISTGCTPRSSGSSAASSRIPAPTTTRAPSTRASARPARSASMIDKALRAHFRDEGLKHRIVRWLVDGMKDKALGREIAEAAADFDRMADETRAPGRLVRAPRPGGLRRRRRPRPGALRQDACCSSKDRSARRWPSCATPA